VVVITRSARLSGKTNKGSTYLRNALIQSAWAASQTKQTYLAAQYRRLVRRKGRKRALVAVGHSILVIAYHMMKRRADYEELGGDYFDRQHTEHLQRRLIRRLERLGLKVVVEPLAEAAWPRPLIFIVEPADEFSAIGNIPGCIKSTGRATVP
jgi:transposase